MAKKDEKKEPKVKATEVKEPEKKASEKKPEPKPEKKVEANIGKPAAAPKKVGSVVLGEGVAGSYKSAILNSSQTLTTALTKLGVDCSGVQKSVKDALKLLD